jgi:serine phosphatase RsbU (regulator of sigma subunit)
MKNFKEEEDRGLSDLVKARKDEIGEMAGIFLGMKTDLSAYQFHLQELVELRTNELQQTNKKLDEANEFLRNRQYQIEHEFMVAQNLQGHLLPEPDRLLGPTQVRALYIPASGVSGDIYDFGMLGERECYFFMADVSGHGVPAAMVTAMIKISLSKIPLNSLAPGKILEHLNEEMVKILDDHYFSATVCKVDFHKRILFYANAGGTPAILVRSLQNKVKILKSTGTVLGVFEGTQVDDFEVRIEPGDKLFLFSDGLSEESGPNKKLFGIRKIINHLKEQRFSTNTDILQSLHMSLKQFSGTSVFKDDITCILANIG